MYSWLLVLVVLMARGRQGGKRRRSSAQQPVEPPPEEVGSEYDPGDDSGPESEEEDSDALTIEVLSKKKGKDTAAPATEKGKEKKKETEKGKGKAKATENVKGKGKKKETAKGKGKEKVQETEPVIFTRVPRRSIGIEIREPGSDSPPRAPQVPVDPRRRSMYSSKHCIGERDVGVANLFEKVRGFQALFENGNLHAICDFPEQTGYCLQLIREFYMRAGHLDKSEGGPFCFTTSVRGVELTITPDTIGSVLEIAARIDGIDYLHAGFDAVMDWRRVMTAICVPETHNNGVLVLSKDLKLEYRFLNFVVCYNIMPLANTKIIRWDRVLYMYLLGHPEIVKERNINLNVPFLVWKRMAKDIKTASQKDRLPFPLLIMRILRLFEVDVRCSSYEHSLGPISDTTMAKSSIQLKSRHPSPPLAPAPARALAPPPTQGYPDDAISISSLYREQQRISGELERLSTGQAQMVTYVAKVNKKVSRMSRLLRNLCDKMGCGSSDMPPHDDDSD